MIWSKVKKFFKPPVFENDEKTRVANLLSYTILTIFLIAIARTILTFFTSPEFLTLALRINSTLLVIIVAVFAIMRTGRVRFACIFFTLYQWTTIALLAYRFGGLNASGYSFFFFVILVAGLLLGGRWALGYAIVSILYGLLLFYLEIKGVITPALESSATVINTIAISFITSAILVYLYHRDITNALARARLNTEELFQTNEQLTHEISAREQIEEQLLRAQKMEAIGTLAGGIAHDFNNSLQAILGYIQILLFDMVKDSSEANKLKLIEASALRATELTQQILTFSRKVKSNLRPVNLNQEVQLVHKLLRRTIPKMIDIELHLENNLKNINGDPAQIEQVMMNIGINARDAMPDGGKLKIETRNTVLDEEYCRTNLEAFPGDHVILIISDNGEGIDKETIERIFDPFYTTKEPDQGTGLGLSMVYGIIRNHGGHITCQSRPGKGTTFKIYFPVLQKDHVKRPERKDKTEMKGGTETILLVDDEDSVRRFGVEILRRFGYTVIAAPDGESALEIYQKKKGDISLIVLDLIMPGMGGKKCLEEILKIDPLQKVTIATGYVANDSAKEILKKGAKGYINKPFRIEQMLAVVREVLDQE